MALWAAAFSESSADPYVKSGCIDLNNPPISSLLTGGGGPGTFCRGAFWVSGARLESRRALPAYHGRLGQSRGLSWWATWRARNPLNLGLRSGPELSTPPRDLLGHERGLSWSSGAVGLIGGVLDPAGLVEEALWRLGTGTDPGAPTSFSPRLWSEVAGLNIPVGLCRPEASSSCAIHLQVRGGDC